jgi:hypothetical protein
MFGIQASPLFTRSNRKPGQRDAARLIRGWICSEPHLRVQQILSERGVMPIMPRRLRYEQSEEIHRTEDT